MKFEVVELRMCDGEVCRLIYSHKDIGYKLPKRVNICGNAFSTIFVEDEHGNPLFNLERSL